jgi:hypothetical protein
MFVYDLRLLVDLLWLIEEKNSDDFFWAKPHVKKKYVLQLVISQPWAGYKKSIKNTWRQGAMNKQLHIFIL